MGGILGVTCKGLQETIAFPSGRLQEIAYRKNLADHRSIRGDDPSSRSAGSRPESACARGWSGRDRWAVSVLLEAVAVHLVVQGAHADAEQLGGPFAVVVALREGGQDRRLLRLV